MQGKTTREAYKIAEDAVIEQARKTRANPNLSEEAKNQEILRRARSLDRLRKRHEIKE